MHFYIGTTNTDKIREIARIVRPLGIGLSTTYPVNPEETGDTLEANAVIKAHAYSQYVGSAEATTLMREFGYTQPDAQTYLRLGRHLVICEDSGLEIPALGGLPGPWSARFDDCQFENSRVIGYTSSTRKRCDIDVANVARVLELMKDIEQPRRVAAFGICLVVADTDGRIVFQTSKRVTGWIADASRGTNGFGYDSIFISDKSFKKTWAEIDSARKDLISHRRLTLQELTLWLANELKKEQR